MFLCLCKGLIFVKLIHNEEIGSWEDGRFSILLVCLDWMGHFNIFLHKTSLRWKVSMLLLISIMLSTTSVWIGPFFVSYTYLFLLVMVCVDISRLKTSKQLYVLFISLIVMFAYVGFCLLELYDPVWIFVNWQWLLTAIILYIGFLLVKDDHMRCIVILLGLLGEIFYIA